MVGHILVDLRSFFHMLAKECVSAGSGMPEQEVVSYGCDIAAGLAYLHGLRPK
ncbi:hypothetical protein AK812_SmicGene47677, partial [Symbiodinium microadriaticum]